MRRIRLFHDYHHQDEQAGMRLVRHLRGLRKHLLLNKIDLSTWGPTQLNESKGHDRAQLITDELQQADIVVLLLSPDFNAEDENARILERAADRHRDEVRPALLILVHWRLCSDHVLIDVGCSEDLLVPGDRPLSGYPQQEADLGWREVERTILNNIFKHCELEDDENEGRGRRGSPLPSPTPRMSPRLLEDLGIEIDKELARLNFMEQAQLFWKFDRPDRPYKIGAFLITGQCAPGPPDETAHRWLFNRLVRSTQLNRLREYEQILIDSPTTGPARDLRILQHNLTSRLRKQGKGTFREERLPRELSWGELVVLAFQMCQTRTVIFTIDRAQELSAEVVDQFLASFWRPLVAKLQVAPASGYVLLFFICYGSSLDSLNLLFKTDIDVDWQPTWPIRMHDVGPFSNRDLRDWLLLQGLDETKHEQIQRDAQGLQPFDVFCEYLKIRLPEGAEELFEPMKQRWFALKG